MKKMITIFEAIIFVSVFFASCGGSNQNQRKQTSKDSINNSAPIMQEQTESLYKQNNIDSLIEINAINEILGKYESKQEYLVEYAGGNVPQGPIMELSITKKDTKIIFSQVYIGDQPYGCTGPKTKASAEMLKIVKIGTDLYQMSMKKLECHYTEGAGCDDINILETSPKNQADFSINVDLTNKSKIIFKSTVAKSKCKYAWDVNRLTFEKK